VQQEQQEQQEHCFFSLHLTILKVGPRLGHKGRRANGLHIEHIVNL
jgi:hypothetical protein